MYDVPGPAFPHGYPFPGRVIRPAATTGPIAEAIGTKAQSIPHIPAESGVIRRASPVYQSFLIASVLRSFGINSIAYRSAVRGMTLRFFIT